MQSTHTEKTFEIRGNLRKCHKIEDIEIEIEDRPNSACDHISLNFTKNITSLRGELCV